MLIIKGVTVAVTQSLSVSSKPSVLYLLCDAGAGTPLYSGTTSQLCRLAPAGSASSRVPGGD